MVHLIGGRCGSLDDDDDDGAWLCAKSSSSLQAGSLAVNGSFGLYPTLCFLADFGFSLMENACGRRKWREEEKGDEMSRLEGGKLG